MTPTRFFWIDPNKFDCCQHRIVSIAMMENLRGMGLPITYVTACLRDPVPYPGFHYIEPRTRVRGLYRIAFLAACLIYLSARLRRGTRVVLIVFPQAFYVALLAQMIGRLKGCRVDVHLDFRTVPVVNSRSLLRAWPKYAAEYLFFWRAPILLARLLATTLSFITRRMHDRVGIASKPHCIWTSGVGDDRIASSPPQPPALPGAPFELLYLGSMSLHRGVEEIVRAVAGARDRLGPFILRILGGGPGADTVSRLIRDLRTEDAVRMEGSVPPDCVPAYLAKAHAFVSPLPDHAWWRVSSPIKIFEYLATGKPLILTDTAPHRDVVPRDVPGVVWLPDLRPESVVAGLRDLIDNYDRHLAGYPTRLGIARKHAWSVQAERLGTFLMDQYCRGRST